MNKLHLTTKPLWLNHIYPFMLSLHIHLFMFILLSGLQSGRQKEGLWEDIRSLWCCKWNFTHFNNHLFLTGLEFFCCFVNSATREQDWFTQSTFFMWTEKENLWSSDTQLFMYKITLCHTCVCRVRRVRWRALRWMDLSKIWWSWWRYNSYNSQKCSYSVTKTNLTEKGWCFV